MRLSIIVPLFNSERFINQCLSSMIEDSLINEYEIIVIDDGSTDNSANLVKDFCSKYQNIVLFQQNNCGVSIARMNGVSKAKGDYIWFIDSDDYLKSDSIKTVLSILKSNSHIDTFIASLIIYEESSGKEYLQWSEKRARTIYKGKDFLKIKPVSVCPPQFIFKKYLFKNKWLTFPVGVRHEDEYFCRVLQYISPNIMVLDTPLYVYRQWQGSFMNSSGIKSVYDMVDVYKRLARFADEAIDEGDQAWFRSDILSFLIGTHSWNAHLFGSEEFKAFRNHHLQYIQTEFKKYSKSLPLKEQILGLFLLKSPGLHKFLLSAKRRQ